MILPGRPSLRTETVLPLWKEHLRHSPEGRFLLVPLQGAAFNGLFLKVLADLNTEVVCCVVVLEVLPQPDGMLFWITPIIDPLPLLLLLAAA